MVREGLLSFVKKLAHYPEGNNESFSSFFGWKILTSYSILKKYSGYSEVNRWGCKHLRELGYRSLKSELKWLGVEAEENYVQKKFATWS